MSIIMISESWKTVCGSHTAKLVLLALADHADHFGGSCFPSISSLAQKCELSRQSVINQIEILKSSGILQINKVIGRTNSYQLKFTTQTDEPKQPEPVNVVDQSTPLTSQRGWLPPVNAVDHHQSTPLAPPVNAVDPNRQQPSVQPSIEPSKELVLPEIPKSLDSEAFRETWSDWIAHRKQIRKKLTPLAVKKQFKELEVMGADRAIAAINYSIANGWQGIFEPKTAQASGGWKSADDIQYEKDMAMLEVASKRTGGSYCMSDLNDDEKAAFRRVYCS